MNFKIRFVTLELIQKTAVSMAAAYDEKGQWSFNLYIGIDTFCQRVKVKIFLCHDACSTAVYLGGSN